MRTWFAALSVDPSRVLVEVRLADLRPAVRPLGEGARDWAGMVREVVGGARTADDLERLLPSVSRRWPALVTWAEGEAVPAPVPRGAGPVPPGFSVPGRKPSYACADCLQAFDTGSAGEGACPACGQKPNRGIVACTCGQRFEVWLPHWYRMCDACSATCPACGGAVSKPCSC